MGDRDSEKETKTQREGCRDLVRARERDGDSELKGNRDLERVDRDLERGGRENIDEGTYSKRIMSLNIFVTTYQKENPDIFFLIKFYVSKLTGFSRKGTL